MGGSPEGSALWLFILALALQRGVEGVEVLLVQAILHDGERLGKALIVDDLAGAQEPQHIDDIGVISQVDQVFVGGAGLLLWYDRISATF